MEEIYYFDTSVWLDFFEERDEPNLPKTKLAKELIKKIVKEKGKIVYSEVVKNEMLSLGYSRYDIDSMFLPIQTILIYANSTRKQFGKAKDLSKKREIPLSDALHAILARDNRALMITRDKHFDKLSDITKHKKPEDII